MIEPRYFMIAEHGLTVKTAANDSLAKLLLVARALHARNFRYFIFEGGLCVASG